MLTALVDADILVYRVGFACDAEPWATAKYVLRKQIEDVCDGADVDEYELYLTGRDNFRNEIAFTKPYKGNRKDTPKPIHFKSLRSILCEEWGAVVIEGKEANDAMGEAQTDDTIICSIDKDLLMIPGWHYNFVKCKRKLIVRS